MRFALAKQQFAWILQTLCADGFDFPRFFSDSSFRKRMFTAFSPRSPTLYLITRFL